MKKRVHLYISGRVQGVMFRKSLKAKADRLQVKGWVRNLSDGRVEAVYAGKADDVNSLLEWTKSGSFLAKVCKIDIDKEFFKNEFQTFNIEPSV